MLILDWIFLWVHGSGSGGRCRDGGGGFLLWVICGFKVVMVVVGGFLGFVWVGHDGYAASFLGHDKFAMMVVLVWWCFC